MYVTFQGFSAFAGSSKKKSSNSDKAKLEKEKQKAKVVAAQQLAFVTMAQQQARVVAEQQRANVIAAQQQARIARIQQENATARRLAAEQELTNRTDIGESNLTQRTQSLAQAGVDTAGIMADRDIGVTDITVGGRTDQLDIETGGRSDLADIEANRAIALQGDRGELAQMSYEQQLALREFDLQEKESERQHQLELLDRKEGTPIDIDSNEFSSYSDEPTAFAAIMPHLQSGYEGPFDAFVVSDVEPRPLYESGFSGFAAAPMSPAEVMQAKMIAARRAQQRRNQVTPASQAVPAYLIGGKRPLNISNFMKNNPRRRCSIGLAGCTETAPINPLSDLPWDGRIRGGCGTSECSMGESTLSYGNQSRRLPSLRASGFRMRPMRGQCTPKGCGSNLATGLRVNCSRRAMPRPKRYVYRVVRRVSPLLF